MYLDTILKVITITSWSLLTVSVIFSYINTSKRYGYKTAFKKLISFQIILPLILTLTISTISASLVFIQPQEMGIVISLLAPEGYRDKPFRSGLQWIFPVLETVIRYPIFWETYTMSGKPLEGQKQGNDAIVARTSDGQEVSIDCSVIFRVDPTQVIQVHIAWQNRYIEELVRPTMRGIVRTQVAGFTIDEVNSIKRQDLEANLDSRLRQVFEAQGLLLDRFILRNIDFSPEYAQSVERKQVALQDIIQAEYKAEQIRKLAAGKADEIKIMAEREAEAVRIKAAAEKDALNLISDALLLNTDLLTYRYIEKLSPGIKVMLVPSNSPFILPLPNLYEGKTQPLFPDQLPNSLEITPTKIITSDLNLSGASLPTPVPATVPVQ